VNKKPKLHTNTNTLETLKALEKTRKSTRRIVRLKLKSELKSKAFGGEFQTFCTCSVKNVETAAYAFWTENVIL